MNARVRRLWWICLALAAVLTVIFLALYALAPGWRKSLVTENHSLEMLSAILALAAAIVGFRAWLALPGRPRILLLIPVTVLLFFLEEISWGEEFLRYPLPVVFGRKLHSVHDLVPYTLWALRDRSPLLLNGLLAATFALGAAAMVPLWKRRASLREGLRRRPALGFFFASLALIALGQISDVEVWHKQAVYFLEELLELNAALVFLFAGLALRLTARPDERPGVPRPAAPP
ncbi:MAG: hypothetical protein C4524_15420 [Candidatus Zixiibacteriota bacterium]|nr:MAG: hypothetical protein C4524_15420 [candidate division Zixibacteria bacterium]